MLGDGVRAIALVSVVLAASRWGPLGSALFLLVLGGTMVPRAIGASDALDVACGCTLLVAAWAAQLDWYVAVSWLDVAVHTAATGLLAVVGWRGLLRWRHLQHAPATPDPWVAGVAIVGIGATLSVLWELAEWFGHTYLDGRIQVGYTDTLGDLAAGVAGATVAAIVRLPGVRRR